MQFREWVEVGGALVMGRNGGQILNIVLTPLMVRFFLAQETADMFYMLSILFFELRNSNPYPSLF